MLSILPHLHSPTFSCTSTLGILCSIRWLCTEHSRYANPAKIHFSPTGLAFGCVCELIPFSTSSCTEPKLLMDRYTARVGEESGGPPPAAATSDCLSFEAAFRAPSPAVRMTFHESLDLAEGF